MAKSGGSNLDRVLVLEMVRVTEAAAIAAAKLIGRGDEKAADAAAVEAMREAFDRRRRRMVELLTAIDGVELMVPQGAFYAFPDLSAFLGRTIAGDTPETTVDLAALVLDAAKVAIVPGEAFGAPGYARLSFALGDDDLGEGLTRIADLLNG